MANPILSREVLASLFKDNHQAIRAFEHALGTVAETPATLEEVAGIASLATAIAQQAVSTIAVLAEAIDQLQFAPAVHLGTLSQQDADHVLLAGGSIDGVTVGTSVRAAGAFTTLAASGQITSSIGGAAPFVVASSFEVANLRAATATALAVPRTIGGVSFNGSADITVQSAAGSFTVGTGFGCNGKSAQTAATVAIAATDLTTVITLANNLRTALINNGIAV